MADPVFDEITIGATSPISAISADFVIHGGTLNVIGITLPNAPGGSGATGDYVAIAAGFGDGAGNGGSVFISSGEGGTSGNGGAVHISAANGGASSGTGGGFIIAAGRGPAGAGGTFKMKGGPGAYEGGALTAVGGDATIDGPGGSIVFQAGGGAGFGNGGDVSFTRGNGVLNGNYLFAGMATTDPAVADALWSGNGVLLMSGATLATALAATDLSALPVADPGGGLVWLKAGDLHVGA